MSELDPEVLDRACRTMYVELLDVICDGDAEEKAASPTWTQLKVSELPEHQETVRDLRNVTTTILDAAFAQQTLINHNAGGLTYRDYHIQRRIGNYLDTPGPRLLSYHVMPTAAQEMHQPTVAFALNRTPFDTLDDAKLAIDIWYLVDGDSEQFDAVYRNAQSAAKTAVLHVLLTEYKRQKKEPNDGIFLRDQRYYVGGIVDPSVQIKVKT